ncbi:MAG: ATP-binding protein [Acidimicrobiales bacterium]
MPLPRLQRRSPAWLRWPRRTARLRFSAVYGGLFLASGAVLLAINYGLFERATEYTKPKLPTVPPTPTVRHLQQLHLLPKPQPGPGFPATSQYGLPQAASRLAAAQHQLAQVQHQLAHHKSVPVYFPPRLAQVQRELAQDQHQLATDRHQLAQATHQLAQAVHQLAQAGPLEAAQRATDSHQLLVNSGIALAIVAMLALVVGWLVASRMLRPIRTITRTAKRISSTSLHERLALDGPHDELKELADTLDDLFGRLDAAFEAQRHFVANASHELRTPLTAERTMLQYGLDDPDTSARTWRSIAEELLDSNREQETLIEALLTLASSEGGLDHRDRADLADICQTVLGRPGLGTDRLGLAIKTAISSAPLEGDPRLVERLLTNLVDNAIRHNVEGGGVQIFTGMKEGKAVFSVTNTGPVVPPNGVARLFQPFQRLDGCRVHHNKGHGLGLSIVRAIATAHCATVAASASPGGGLSVDVTFPPPAQHGLC